MPYSFFRVEQGYDPAEVDAFLSDLESRLQEYQTNKDMLVETVINSQASAEQIRQKAKADAEIIVAYANLETEVIRKTTEKRVESYITDITEVLMDHQQLEGDSIKPLPLPVVETRKTESPKADEPSRTADMPQADELSRTAHTHVETSATIPLRSRASVSKLPTHRDQYFRRKERYKSARTVLQWVCMSFLITAICLVFIYKPYYVMAEKDQWTQNEGFIALSYVGVSRSSHETLVSRKNIEEQLTALKEAGYVTINNQDVVNFYKNGMGLPEKALYLMFEDGRKDNALLVQPILEKLNFSANFFTYSNNIENRDIFFLKGDDINSLSKNGFWDFGLNGYKFQYINVYQEETEESGSTVDPNEMTDKKKDKYYDFFLTNYMYDEYRNIDETYEEMNYRIETDYDTAVDTFVNKSGQYPNAYVFMCSNALYSSVPLDVAEVNIRKIQQYFQLMFSRDTTCYNNASTNIYDLSRLQVQPDWSVNRLIMEIEHCYPNYTPFVINESMENLSRLNTVSGVLNADMEKLILTAPYGARALTLFDDANEWPDLKISVDLTDNRNGVQSVYLRYTSNDSFVRLSIKENKLTVSIKEPGEEIVNLYSAVLPGAYLIRDLWDRFDVERIAGRDELTAQERALEAFYNTKYSKDALFKLEASKKDTIVWWPIEAELIGNRLVVRVNGIPISESIYINESVSSGSIALECYGNDFTAYDGYFDNLSITPLTPFYVGYTDISDLKNSTHSAAEMAIISEDNVNPEEFADAVFDADVKSKAIYLALSAGVFDLVFADKPLPSAILTANKLIADRALISDEILNAEKIATLALTEENKASAEEMRMQFIYRANRNITDILSGIVIQPGADEINELIATANRVHDLGYKAGALLSCKAAEALADYCENITLDWIALDLDVSSQDEPGFINTLADKIDKDKIFIKYADSGKFTAYFTHTNTILTYDAEAYSNRTVLEKVKDMIYLIRDTVIFW